MEMTGDRRFISMSRNIRRWKEILLWAKKDTQEKCSFQCPPWHPAHETVHSVISHSHSVSPFQTPRYCGEEKAASPSAASCLSPSSLPHSQPDKGAWTQAHQEWGKEGWSRAWVRLRPGHGVGLWEGAALAADGLRAWALRNWGGVGATRVDSMYSPSLFSPVHLLLLFLCRMKPNFIL